LIITAINIHTETNYQLPRKATLYSRTHRTSHCMQ